LEKQIESGQSFLDEHGMPESRHELAVQRLAALNGELTRAEAERAKAEIHLESLQTQNPASFPEVVDNPSIESARKQYEELLKAGDELAKRFGPDWPERSRVAASLEEAEKRLDAAVQEASERVLNVARHEYEAALKHEARLRQQAENERKKAESLEYLVATHDGATLELETQKRLLGELLRRESEAGLTVDLRQQSTINARIVEEATPPGGPYKPNLRKNLLMATAAGIFLAVGFAFFIEYWDSTIDTPEDLRRTVSIRYLGLIPRFENPPSANHPRRVPLPPGEVDNPAQYLALSLDESNLSEERRQISEHFNFVRTMLISSTHRPKTILVTSPDEKSGKTFVACNLAISLAKLEGRVLLVDADLRIPRLHQVFSVRNQRGLADLLRERTVTTPEYVRTDLDTLFLLTAGIDRRAPSEQLSADSTRSAIAAFAETFDYVVIDSAPLLPVPDSVALALHCEEVLLVVRSGYTTHQSLRASLDFVERTNGVVSGVILNDVDMNTLASSYYRSYRSTSY
jgi:capsular exopolysaccharide synthesis family protein